MSWAGHPGPGEGDDGWVGIDMTRDKPSVSQGRLSRGQNTRLVTRKAKQRNGTAIPQDFNPVGGFVNSIIGSGVYRNPTGDQVLLVAPAGVTYTLALQSGRDPLQINYSAAEIAGGRTNGFGIVTFAQSFDKVNLFRRPVQAAQKNLVWDGVSGHNWEIIALSAFGKELIPTVWNGEPFMDRIVYYSDNYGAVPWRDQWLVSDIEDYTSYDSVYQSIRTNTGESDYITRIMGYFRGSVIVFKSHSIHQVSVLRGLYPFQVEQRQLTTTLGSIGNKMPLEVGGDVIFLSLPNGFYRLSEVIQEQIVTLPLPISEQIQDIVDQINWLKTATFGCSEALGNYAFFGVALGPSTQGLNAILVYNTQSKEWESAPDTWADPGFTFHRLHVTTYGGVDRLFAVDYVNGTIYLLYEGVADELRSGTFSVPYLLETRGYTGGDTVAFKRFGRASVAVSMSGATAKVTAISDGFNEEKVLGTITKDRAEFYIHGHKLFDPTVDDPDEPKREDYSSGTVSDFATEDFEDLPLGPIAQLPGTPGLIVGNKQQSVERFLVRSNARWCALRIENNSGQCDVLSVGVESTPAVTTARTAA
jgi:hypothetical protein